MVLFDSVIRALEYYTKFAGRISCAGSIILYKNSKIHNLAGPAYLGRAQCAWYIDDSYVHISEAVILKRLNDIL